MLRGSRLLLPRLPRHCVIPQLSAFRSNSPNHQGGKQKASQFHHSTIALTIELSSKAAKMTSPIAKRQRTSPSSQPYELYYWPGMPGRGEHVRLAFEEAGVTYKDVSNETKDGFKMVVEQISDKNTGEGSNPPPLAPPILRHGDLLVSQTPNILLYLGPQLDLVPSREQDPNGIFHVNSLTLTALDGLSNETHDTHHPIAINLYYEDQKEEAKRKVTDYIENRLPKFLRYFEHVLKSEASKGGEWLYGGNLTYADLVLFQTIDGVQFAFPKAMGNLQKSKKYNGVFGLVDRVRNRDNIKEYLASDRRQPYNMGIYRHYPELDAE